MKRVAFIATMILFLSFGNNLAAQEPNLDDIAIAEVTTPLPGASNLDGRVVYPSLPYQHMEKMVSEALRIVSNHPKVIEFGSDALFFIQGITIRPFDYTSENKKTQLYVKPMFENNFSHLKQAKIVISINVERCRNRKWYKVDHLKTYEIWFDMGGHFIGSSSPEQLQAEAQRDAAREALQESFMDSLND